MSSCTDKTMQVRLKWTIGHARFKKKKSLVLAAPDQELSEIETVDLVFFASCGLLHSNFSFPGMLHYREKCNVACDLV